MEQYRSDVYVALFLARRKIYFVFHSFLIANEVTMFFVCSIASWVAPPSPLSQRHDHDKIGYAERERPAAIPFTLFALATLSRLTT